MSRIEINADGRHIIVDHDGELEPLRRSALELWQAAEAKKSPGPATGFQLIELRHTPSVDPIGNGAYGLPPAPVNARCPVKEAK